MLCYNSAWATVIILPERPPVTAATSASMPSSTAAWFLFQVMKYTGNDGFQSLSKTVPL